MENDPRPQFSLRGKTKAAPKKKAQTFWIGLFVVITIFTFAKTFPTWNQYFNQHADLETLKIQNKILQSDLNQLEIQQTAKRTQREEKGKAFLKKERQWFPNRLDTAEVAGILEIVSLQLENLDLEREAHFNLKTLRFTPPPKEQNYYQAQLSFSTDPQNLKIFIDYLQRGTIPAIIHKGVQQKFIPQNILSMLEDKPLPLSTIQNIQINQENQGDRLSVNLTLHFYIRPS